MKLRTITAAMFTATIAGSGFVHADPPKQLAPIAPIAPAVAPALTPPPPITVVKAPIALDASRKLIRANAALKLAGLPAITALPFMDARLSPVTPRLPNNGGEITLAFGLTQFVGATSDQPDGAYSLASSGTGYAAVFLRLATEVNKFHILDCRVQVSQSAKLTFLHSGGSGTSNPPVEDGHVVYAFKANASKTDVTVGFQPLSNTGNTFNLGSFYGCEVVK